MHSRTPRRIPCTNDREARYRPNRTSLNNTDLSYKEIGAIMDVIIEDSKEDTHYFGQTESILIKYKEKDKIIRVEIRYLKRYVEWRFY